MYDSWKVVYFKINVQFVFLRYLHTEWCKYQKILKYFKNPTLMFPFSYAKVAKLLEILENLIHVCQLYSDRMLWLNIPYSRDMFYSLWGTICLITCLQCIFTSVQCESTQPGSDTCIYFLLLDTFVEKKWFSLFHDIIYRMVPNLLRFWTCILKLVYCRVYAHFYEKIKSHNLSNLRWIRTTKIATSHRLIRGTGRILL